MTYRHMADGGAFLRIIATLLDLRLDRVIARDAAVRRRRAALYASALLLALAAVVFLVWYNVPHTAYYVDYTYEWEKPVGIQEVSSSRRRQMDYTYRFTTLRGDVIQVERVNSAGTLTSGSISLGWDDPPSMRFYYGTSDSFGGRVVTRVAYYNIYGQELYEKRYSADLYAVDFVQSGHSSSSFFLGTDLLSSQAAVGTSDDDNRGSSGGTATRDENGAWGVGYLRDDLGRVVGTRSLDRDGVFMADSNGSAGYDYAYGESGRIVSETCVDLSGSPTVPEDNAARTVVEYNELGHVVEIAYFDAGGERVLRSPDGVSVYRRSYDDRGFMIFWEAYDHMLEPCYDSSGTFSAVFLTDDNGRCLRSDLYGPDGKLQPCADGYASVTRTYTSNGQVTQERYWGADGTPALNLSQNLYGIDYTFTDGLLTRIDYFNDQGRPMRSKKGVASVCREYNGERQLSREWYLSEDGEPVRFSDGYAEACFSYTDGNRTRTDYYDETGAPCRDSSGVASKTYYDAENRECTPMERGASYYGASQLHYEYDQRGNLARKVYFPRTGVSAPGHVWDVVYTYDDYGNMTSERWRDRDGAPVVVSSGDGHGYSSYAYAEADYDAFGRVVEKRGYNAAGALTKRNDFVYDSHGRTIQVTTYGANGSVQLVEDNVYDEFGNRIQQAYTDGAGQPCMPTGEFALSRSAYDVFGNMTDRWIYDEAGNPCDGAFHEAYTYTVTGTALTGARYDANEQLIKQSAGTLDNYDRPVEVRVYTADGSCTGRVVYTYSPNGKLTECSYYDWAGSMVDFECRELYISEVLESSPAAEAGLRANDILIVYNLWSFSSTLVDPKETFTDLYLEIQAGQETDKHIVVCRVSEDFTEVTFIEVLLPVGQAGIRLGDGTVYSSGVSALVDAYEQWREGGSQEGAAFPAPA